MEIFRQFCYLKNHLMKKAALLAALALSLTGFAQNGKTGFQKGQKLEMTTEIKKTSSMELMGQSMESTVTSTMTTIYDVKDVTPAGSVVEHKVKRLVFSADAMGKTQTFDSEKEGDINGEMGKILGKSIKNKYTLSLDAAGKVTAVKLDDDNPNDDEAAMMAEIISSQLGLPLSIPKTGTSTELYTLPNRQLKKGDTWTDSSSFEGNKSRTVYTVNSITDADIVLDYTEDTYIDKKMNIMGTEANLTSKNKATGQVTIDRKTGILRQKTATVDAEGSIEGQGQIIPNKDKITMTITVKSA
jgi:hypothetical protein